MCIMVGEDIAGKTVAMLAGEVGYVFQNPDDQIFKYHVIDEVMFGPLNIGMSAEEAKKHAVAALTEVGLEKLVNEILMTWNCPNANWLRLHRCWPWILKC